jgi:hypothetical protein
MPRPNHKQPLAPRLCATKAAPIPQTIQIKMASSICPHSAFGLLVRVRRQRTHCSIRHLRRQAALRDALNLYDVEADCQAHHDAHPRTGRLKNMISGIASEPACGHGRKRNARWRR